MPFYTLFAFLIANHLYDTKKDIYNIFSFVTLNQCTTIFTVITFLSLATIFKHYSKSLVIAHNVLLTCVLVAIAARIAIRSSQKTTP
jgi:hypothetical protein